MASMILAKGNDASDLQSSGGNSAILPTTDRANDSSATQIMEGGGSVVPSGCGSEGVGGLLAVNKQCPQHSW
jgi:hypothetical protein